MVKKTMAYTIGTGGTSSAAGATGGGGGAGSFTTSASGGGGGGYGSSGAAPPHKFTRRSNQWFWRRALVFIITAFCMTALTWLMWNGAQDGKLHQLIAEGCMWLLATIYVTYVVGATTDDLVSLAKGVRGIQEKEVK